MPVIHTKSEQGLSLFPDNYFHSTVCDPPYEQGLLGRAWDSSGIAFNIENWQQVCRVMRPGAYLLAFGSARTYHRLASAIEAAGFEIRDQIIWMYATGMGKSKKLPDGWGTSLKPTHEPICVARKPMIEANTLANMQAHGAGGINVDACRVLTRFPKNLIHDGSPEVTALFPDSDGCGGSVPRVKVTGYGKGVVGTGASDYLGGDRIAFDSGTGSAARFFYCAKPNPKDRNYGLAGVGICERCLWVGQGERCLKCGGPTDPARNEHETVKPLTLIRYLQRLVTIPGGSTLDLFAGSNTSGVAAKLEGFQYVGFEERLRHAIIGNARENYA